MQKWVNHEKLQCVNILDEIQGKNPENGGKMIYSVKWRKTGKYLKEIQFEGLLDAADC